MLVASGVDLCGGENEGSVGECCGDECNLVGAGKSGADCGECVGDVVEVLLDLMVDSIGK